MRSMKSDPDFGLDSRWSWITAVFSSACLFMGCLGTRVMGVIYVGIITTFNVSREEASWPMTALDGAISTFNPIFGYLCHRYSCRAVLVGCSLAGGLGIMACFFAPNVAYITFFYGVVYGACAAGLMMGLSVVLAQRFEQRRATAFSLLFAVSGLNTFFIPPVLEFCIQKYGLHGALLILGVISLNAFPASLILSSPEWATPRKRPPEPRAMEASSEDAHPTEEEMSLTVVENGNSDTTHRAAVTQDQTSLRTTWKNFLMLNFWVDSMSYGVIYFGLSLFLTLVMDLAKDRGISGSTAVFLFHAFSLGDVVSRTLNGWTIDRGWLSLEAIMLLGFVLQAIGYQLLVWCATLPSLLLTAVVLGVGNGLRISLGGVVLISDFGVEALPIMIGGLYIVAGLYSWVRPPLIGYFRDQHGSYDGVLHVSTALSAFFSVAWAGRLSARRWQKNKIRSIL